MIEETRETAARGFRLPVARVLAGEQPPGLDPVTFIDGATVGQGLGLLWRREFNLASNESGAGVSKVDELAIAAEEIEREELVELHRAAGPELARTLGMRLEEFDGALASVVPGAGIVLNRVVGLGVRVPADPGTPARIRRFYEDALAGRFFLHLHPGAQPPELPERVRDAGFVSARAWRKFRRRAGPVEPRPTTLTIREIDTAHAGAFGRIAADAFDLGPAAASLVAGLVGRPGWRIFMSFEGEEPAGTGAVYVRDRIAWTDWGATRPKFRRRGSQGALLAARLEAAREAGCEWIFTCTGEAVPGDPQHSYGNILKSGFEEWTLRPNFAPARLEQEIRR